MAGKKGRSGCKCNARMAHAQELLATAVPDSWWREIFDKLVGMALGDDDLLAVKSARLLFRYAFAILAQDFASEE